MLQMTTLTEVKWISVIRGFFLLMELTYLINFQVFVALLLFVHLDQNLGRGNHLPTQTRVCT